MKFISLALYYFGFSNTTIYLTSEFAIPYISSLYLKKRANLLKDLSCDYIIIK